MPSDTFHSTMFNMASNKDCNMVVDSFDTLFEKISDNYDEVRGHSLALSTHSPRTSSMSSSDCKEEYAVRVKRISDRIDENKPVTSSDSIQLKYATSKSQNSLVSKVANNTSSTCQQHVSNVDLTLNLPQVNNVVNVQLNYNINQALDLKSQNGEFHTVSLYGSIEYLASDVKNIKESLSRIDKYILDKSINSDKANNIKDLEGVGRVAWNFLLAIYEAHWDTLYVDNFKMSFRNKVKSKFNPQISKPTVNNKDKDTVKPTYVSLLSPPILAKLPKEVNKISKYFKKNKKQPQKKLYAQVSLKLNTSNITMDSLKIKKTFPCLQNQKIDQV